MTHLHITTWAVAFLLFIAVFILQKGEKERVTKILQMILRLVYILVIATGIYLFFQVDPGTGYHIKMALGILTISLMEVFLIQHGKGKVKGTVPISFIILFVATIYLGFRLPLGIYFQ